MEVEEADALVIEKLDIDKDHMINEDEFVAGFEKLLSSTSAPAPVSDSESQEDTYQTWEEIDMVVERSEAKQKLINQINMGMVKGHNICGTRNCYAIHFGRAPDRNCPQFL